MIDPDTNPTQDTEHHLREPETLAKVLPSGGPLLGRDVCPSCGSDPEDQRLNPYGSCELCGHLGGGT